MNRPTPAPNTLGTLLFFLIPRFGRIGTASIFQRPARKIEASPFFCKRESRKNRSVPNFSNFLAVLFCCFTAAGCATPYQASGFQGGLVDGRLSDDEFWIEFEGNVGLDPDAVERSLLRRAAELTQQHGFTSFVITERSRQAGLGFVLRPGVFGPSRQTQRSIRIQCFSGHPGVGDAFEAEAVLHPAGEAVAPSSI